MLPLPAGLTPTPVFSGEAGGPRGAAAASLRRLAWRKGDFSRAGTWGQPLRASKARDCSRDISEYAGIFSVTFSGFLEPTPHITEVGPQVQRRQSGFSKMLEPVGEWTQARLGLWFAGAWLLPLAVDLGGGLGQASGRQAVLSGTHVGWFLLL